MRVIFSLFAFLMFNVVSAQNATISGVVTTDEGIVLPDALIEIQDLGRSTVSSEEGYYLLSDLEEGFYTIKASYLGRTSVTKYVNVSGNIDLDFELVSSNTFEEIIVSAVRAGNDDPFAYTNVSKKDIADRNLGQDIPVLLKYQPSVVSSSDAGAGVGYTYMRVRGSDATRINVTINGIPYNDTESQGTFWVDIPDVGSSVENIQLQRGVGTSTNGSSAFGASLNILTDNFSQDAYGILSSSYGSYNTIKNTLKFSSGAIGNFELSGRYSDIQSDGYVDRATSDLNGYQLQGTYKDNNRVIKALTFGGHERTYQAWYGLTAEELKKDRRQNPYTYENEVDDYRQDHYQFHWNENLATDFSMRIGLNYTHGKGYFEQEKKGASAADMNNLIVDKTTAYVRRWLDNDFYVGNLSGTLDKENYKIDFGGSYSEYLGDHYGEVIDGTFADGASAFDRYYFSDSKKTDLSGFGKASINVTENTILYGDLQLRKVGYATQGLTSDRATIAVDTSYTFFNPKVGVTQKINDNTSIYASYARANREPNRNDFENGVTSHESLNDFEIGTRIRDSKYSFNANIYYMNYTNQLVLTGAINDVGAPLRGTSGKSYRLGLELNGSIQLSPKLEWVPSVTISRNKNLDFFAPFDGKIQSFGNTDISFSPGIIASNIFSITPKKGLKIDVLSKYVGSQYMSNIESKVSKLDGYFVQDLVLSYTITPKSIAEKINLRFMVNNLFDTEYVDRGYYYNYDDTWSDPNKTTTIEGTGYYPQATRNVLAGIEIKF